MAKIGLILAIALGIVFHLYWQAGFPYTHDGENHVARFADYAAAIRQGQIPPRIAPNIWSGVGYPVFIFNYPLSNILSLPLSALNVPYADSFKLLAVAYVMIGGVGFWLWLSHFLPQLSPRSKLVGLLTWLSFPFLISTIYFRGNIGEIAAYGLLPWLFVGIELVRSNARWSWLVVVAATATFLLAHNISAVFVWPLVLGYAFYRFNEKWLWWKLWLVPSALGGLMTTWFWLPALFEKQFTVLDSASNNSAAVAHAPTIWQLLSGAVRFGFSYPGSLDTLSFSLGITWLVLLVGVFVYFQKKTNNKANTSLRFLLWVTIVLIVLQVPPLARIWNAPYLHFIQFPWRLSLFLGLPVAGLAALVWQHANTPIRYVVATMLILGFCEVALLKPADYVYKTSEDFASFPHSTTTQNENRPKTFVGLHGEIPPYASIMSGQGSVSIGSWKGHVHTYEVLAQSTVVIAEATIYYPGWNVTARNLETQEVASLPVDTTLHNGWLSYTLPSGNYAVVSSFTENTWPRVGGDILSLIALAGAVTIPTILGRRSKD